MSACRRPAIRPSTQSSIESGIQVQPRRPTREPVADAGPPFDRRLVHIVEHDLAAVPPARPGRCRRPSCRRRRCRRAGRRCDSRQTGLNASNGWRHAAAVEEGAALGRAERAVPDDLRPSAQYRAARRRLGLGTGRGDPGAEQGRQAGGRDAVRRPGDLEGAAPGPAGRRAEPLRDGARMTSSAGQPTKVGRSSTSMPSASTSHVVDHPEVDDRDHRQLRVHDLGECVGRSPRRAAAGADVAADRRPPAIRDWSRLAHHVAPGSLRRTDVNSPHSQSNGAVVGPAAAGRGGGGIGRSSRRTRGDAGPPAGLELGHRGGQDRRRRRVPARRRAA